MSQQALDLDSIREQITNTDQQLLELLAQRRQLTGQVADAKIASGKQVRDQVREEQLLVELVKKGRELTLDAHFITKIFHAIIEDSVLNQQAKLQQLANPDSEQPLNRVAFLGTKGSYSYLATQKYFSRRPGELLEIGCSSFSEIIEAVESNKADYAVLPIENTSSGSINEVFDVLQHTSLSIIGELTHPIKHALLTATDSQVKDIRTFYAHPQVFSQCSHYLAELEDITVNPAESTSAAMLKVSELKDPSVAAIGSAEGGNLYGLRAIESNLANQKENHSRFIVVARKPVEVPDQIPAKTTLIMSTAQRPGSLVEALLVLRDQGINMTKLESRPITGNPWEEMFYIDINANANTPGVQQALKELVKLTRFIKVLGCYPSEEVDATEIPTSALIHKSTPLAIDDESSLGSRSGHLHDTVIQVKNVNIGLQHFSTIAALENLHNADEIQQSVSQLKDAGIECIYLPSTNKAFISETKGCAEQLNVPLILPVETPEQVTEHAKLASMLLISSSDMDDRALLRQAGMTHRPVILQRGIHSSVEDWLSAAEEILQQGNQQVILCEQGIKTLDSSSRYTLDLSAIPELKTKTHLPIIVAPGLVADSADAVKNLSLAAKTLGAHGVILPVSEQAHSDNMDQAIINSDETKEVLAELY